MDGAILTPKRTEYGKHIRKAYENGEIKESRRNMYELEPRIDGVSNTLTTVQKDNLSIEVKQIGNIYADRENFKNPQCGRVYDSSGLSPKINTCQGGQREPKIIVSKTKCLNEKGGTAGIMGLQPSVQDRIYSTDGISTSITTSYMPSILEKQIVSMRGRNPDNPSDRTAGCPTEQRLELNSQGICNALTNVQKDNMVLIKQATNQGYAECKCGGVADLSFPQSKTRRGRVQDKGNVCPTITTEPNGLHRIETQYRIRKLTPLECWRLMGFSDEDFRKAEEVNSNSQLYKQAGNSIVKNVLIAIFGQMIPGKENFYREI